MSSDPGVFAAHALLADLRTQVHGWRRDGNGTLEAHAVWRARLLACSGVGHDLAWLEAMLLLDVAFRQNPAQAFERLRILQARYQVLGTPELFTLLWVELQGLMHPHTLCDHGYLTGLASREPAKVFAELGALLRRLSGYGLRCIVNSGTLLGVVRDGTLIGHDDDVDLAVLLAASTAADAAAEWKQIRIRLRDAWILDREFERKGLPHCKLGRVGGVSVDLFPAWIEAGRLYVWPYACGELAEADLLPVGTLAVGDVKLPIPANPDALLTCNYGAGWRTPDPAFRFDWQQAYGRFQTFLAAGA